MNGLNRRMLIGTAIGLLGAGVVLYIPPSVAFTAPPDVATYRALIEKLSPLHKPLGKPEPGDWLAEHKEAGQTFDEYIRSKPVVPSGKRTILYVQPLGDFTPKQREIVDATADFLGRYYVCTVKVNRDLPLSLVPDKARRDNPFTTKPQILSTFVFNDLLKPRLPDDALAMIALTASDLWPGEGWNYVFGQASTRDRVGVWSLHRFGNPEQGDESYRVCLLRTLKTASHETGHMISIDHCTKYECNMCGSNNLGESDRHPLEVCPQCVAKICWATSADPQKRFTHLADFCRKHSLVDEADFYEKSAAAVEKRK